MLKRSLLALLAATLFGISAEDDLSRVALVTYGPGALNTLNPVACAYAEQSPLLVVSGGPEVALRRPDLNLHHVIKTFERLQTLRLLPLGHDSDEPPLPPEPTEIELLTQIRDAVRAQQ